MLGAQRIAHLFRRRQVGAAPEAVGHTGGDHQHVVRLGPLDAVGVEHPDLARVEVDAGEAAMHHPHVVEPPIAVVRDPVVARPVVGAGEPDPEFLAAHVRGLRRHADDVGVPGEMDRGEQAGVAETGDHHPRAAHRMTLAAVRDRVDANRGPGTPPSTSRSLPVTQDEAGDAR